MLVWAFAVGPGGGWALKGFACVLRLLAGVASSSLRVLGCRGVVVLDLSCSVEILRCLLIGRVWIISCI